MGDFNLEMSNVLLHDVQMNSIFPDGKTFVDCCPKWPLLDIVIKYNQEKDKAGFDLYKFVMDNYELPAVIEIDYKSNPEKSVAANIEALWPMLTRMPADAYGSLLALPKPYIVPGGRFGEIYYWDSYFTMLGLKTSGKIDMIVNMVENFTSLIDTYGFIPNGNRDYFLGRSQPPFYSSMIKLLAQIKGESVYETYLPQLEKEYAFWMRGSYELNTENKKRDRVVLMPGGEILNRYWDNYNSPRPESYREDVELANVSGRPLPETYRQLRAGAESGWDYSSRWFKDKKSFQTIHTTDIIPVDLNCLLFQMEETLAFVHHQLKNENAAVVFSRAAIKRKIAIQKYCWNDAEGFYFDYDFISQKQKNIFSLAAAFPLFFNISSENQAQQIAAHIKNKFLHDGGLITTLENTGQQWDAPNGWAPLHWITITGLENYGVTELAETIARRWIKLGTDVFQRTGRLMEKYNVVDTNLEAGGGEYPGQDGFGWTNGVLLALMEKYGNQ